MGHPAPTPNGPLIPRPAVTLIALALTLGMLGNVWLDASSVDYDGGQTTLIFAALIAGILGIPLGIAAFRSRNSGTEGGDRR